MIETVSLLNELRESQYEGAVLTTFNCHLPFLEDVIIRRLQASGCRHIIVLADRNQLMRAVASDPPRTAGRDYVLIPVVSHSAFHPKMLLLAGPRRGFLAVGSHNLTLSGFGLNREVTNVLRFTAGKSEAQRSQIVGAWRVLGEWMARGEHDLGQHESILKGLERMAPWLEKSGGESGVDDAQVFVGGPDTEPLYQQIRPLLPTKVRSLVVCGAFFDSKLELIQRLRDEHEPEQGLRVCVDPDTVSLPGKARNLDGVAFYRATGLGPSGAKYLHAKMMYLSDGKAGHCLISGSANPSAPAWLRKGRSANDEAVVVRTGRAAKAAAAALGLLSDQPSLDAEDWDAVETAWRERATDSNGASTVLSTVAVGDDNIVTILMPRAVKRLRLELLGRDGLIETRELEAPAGKLSVTLPDDNAVIIIRVVAGERCLQTLLLHYTAMLEGHARSGLQRKFRSALTSLDSDSPDLAALFSCIEKVVFDAAAPRTKMGGGRASAASSQQASPDTLAISISELRQSKTRARLTDGSDLGYFIDILIRALSDETREFSEVDDFGRNEEEQVGSDDVELPQLKRSEATAEKVLALCHRKIRRLVKKTLNMLSAFAAGELADRVLITRLTAVVGLLRQLRAHDRHTWWVNPQRGETTVPVQQLNELSEGVFRHLFNSPLFFAEPRSEDTELLKSDELARVRGLIFWLGAQCGLELRLEPGFNETRETRLARLDAAARFVSLSEIVHGDALTLAEAEEAIGTTDASRRAQLQRALSLGGRLAALVGDGAGAGSQARSGDIAFHPDGIIDGCRVVLSSDGKSIHFVARGGGEGRAFLATKLRCIPAAQLSS